MPIIAIASSSIDEANARYKKLSQCAVISAPKTKKSLAPDRIRLFIADVRLPKRVGYVTSATGHMVNLTSRSIARRDAPKSSR